MYPGRTTFITSPELQNVDPKTPHTGPYCIPEQIAIISGAYGIGFVKLSFTTQEFTTYWKGGMVVVVVVVVVVK